MLPARGFLVLGIETLGSRSGLWREAESGSRLKIAKIQG
jgi:hypothetical protein